jgi:hypothetical protein
MELFEKEVREPQTRGREINLKMTNRSFISLLPKPSPDLL